MRLDYLSQDGFLEIHAAKVVIIIDMAKVFWTQLGDADTLGEVKLARLWSRLQRVDVNDTWPNKDTPAFTSSPDRSCLLYSCIIVV
jgi:hypothetical protein